jgi:hypothetical protein
MDMLPYFYSLGMLVNSRYCDGSPYLTAMDLLERQIADEEKELHPLLEQFPQFRRLK